jgi:hypothetical protein
MEIDQEDLTETIILDPNHDATAFPDASIPLGASPNDPDVLYRVDEILMAIKILAYLSKYPALRADLHSAYAPQNVFELVEIFTSPSNILEVRKWATICMRNAFKRDAAHVSTTTVDAASGSGTSSTALRRCGFLECGKFEEQPRQYSKCSRCRRVNRKACQRSAWTLHKNWVCFFGFNI